MPIHYISRGNSEKFRGRSVLLRVDLNVEPAPGRITFRLASVMPTIRFLLAHGARVVILSHRGRPRGYSRKLSMRPFVPILQKELRQNIGFITTFNLPNKGRVFLVENLRFWHGEEKNDANFAKKLARLGDFYVNDAFAVSHRKNASVVAITKYLPSYAGLLFEREVKNLGGILKYTTNPFVIILGGSKASDKIGMMKYFWNKADYFLLGGGPANTFFAAKGLPIGDSLIDRGSISQVLRLIRKEIEPRKIVLPVDVKIKDRKILDIGDGTTRKYSILIRKARTIIWNGPMGQFEKRGFGEGTAAIWKAILRNSKAKIIVGGGETTASSDLISNFSSLISRKKNLFLSTGGGAMLEFLSGKKLPGIEVLK
ncbi:MAG TPA: phosphoglycerate kinase [Candidatus Paceibacterota bacterium]|nr:phosphoglycerate kinase [Candidatus Paceibacterota bacterium]